jgi:hypothetical protein
LIVEPSRVSESPANPGWIRLSADVQFETGNKSRENYWLDFAPGLGDAVQPTGNPWVAMLGPLAATLGERLAIADPVDRLLLENGHELVDVWKSWYERMYRIKIEAPVDDSPVEDHPIRVAAFFSGGLDSFFTALRNQHATHLKPAIDDLVTVWGLDIPITSRAVYEQAEKSNIAAAEKLGKHHFTVATNLRSPAVDAHCSWEKLMHGPAMAAVALALDRHYTRFLIPSSYAYIDNMPYGSHPLTDALFSTRRMRIIHDGGGYKRIPKAELVATSSIAHEHVRVCWEGGSAENCCLCSKCVRTMIVFEALDALKHFKVFKPGALSLERLRRFHVRAENEFKPLELLLPYIKQRGKQDLYDALSECLTRSRRLNRRISALQKLNRVPLLGKMANRAVWRLNAYGSVLRGSTP